MKQIFLLLLTLSTSISFAQVDGKWKGIMIRDGQKIDQATAIYFDLSNKPTCREELPTNDAFAVKQLKPVTSNGTSKTYTQGTTLKKKDVFGHKFCILDFTLKYNDSTGYLEGSFISKECRGNTGKIYCYKTNEEISLIPAGKTEQIWIKSLIEDIKNNRKSLEKRQEELKNFVFEPIYFDYDKADIRSEAKTFLDKVVNIINSHTDLRVKVSGNTDSDGSDGYNNNLSKRRAQAIIDYFVAAGLKRDRIVIEFNGEKKPVSDNNTENGKQLNRRVEFSFI